MEITNKDIIVQSRIVSIEGVDKPILASAEQVFDYSYDEGQYQDIINKNVKSQIKDLSDQADYFDESINTMNTQIRKNIVDIDKNANDIKNLHFDQLDYVSTEDYRILNIGKGNSSNAQEVNIFVRNDEDDVESTIKVTPEKVIPSTGIDLGDQDNKFNSISSQYVYSDNIQSTQIDTNTITVRDAATIKEIVSPTPNIPGAIRMNYEEGIVINAQTEDGNLDSMQINNHSIKIKDNLDSSVFSTLTANGLQIGNTTNAKDQYLSPDGQSYDLHDSVNELVGNEFAKLDSNGKIPSAQLPSYVDDVLEFTAVSAFPTVGETGKIYVSLDSNTTYRWSGTQYIEISKSIGLGTTASTAFPGNRGVEAENKINDIKTINVEITPDDSEVSLQFSTQSKAISFDNAIPSVSTTYAGVMTPEDKTKLDNINVTDINKAIDYSTVADTYTDKKVNIGWETIDGSGTGANVDINAATTSLAGVMTAQDKLRLDSIFAGNMPLPTPTITGTWSFFKNDGTTNAGLTGIDPNNPTLEKGYKAQFSGSYKWVAASGKKNPTQIQSGSNWSDLPASNVNSSTYTSNKVNTNTTIKIGIQAAKTGLMVSGANVVPATGMDTATASKTVSFKDRTYCGISTTKDITKDIMKTGTTQLVTSRQLTKDGVTTNSTQYYFYAYPKSLGDLTSIIQDGATPVLGAFEKKILNITNDANLSIDYNIYISANTGAFTNVQLKFN